MPIIAAPVEAIAVLGFVGAGVPVYYLTQAEQDSKPRIVCAFSLVMEQSENIHSPRFQAFFEDIFARVLGRPSSKDGWQAVATEGDDALEMTQTRSHR